MICWVRRSGVPGRPRSCSNRQKGWTYGVLVNHIWSFAGESGRAEVNATFLQPFVSYTTKTFTSFTVNTESTYDWQGHNGRCP